MCKGVAETRNELNGVATWLKEDRVKVEEVKVEVKGWFQ